MPTVFNERSVCKVQGFCLLSTIDDASLRQRAGFILNKKKKWAVMQQLQPTSTV